MSFIEYSAFQLVAIFAAYLIAGSAKGVTGLGFSTISLPLLTLSIGLKDALPLVIIPSITSNVIVMVGAGNFVPVVKRFWLMLATTIPGIVFGLWWLDYVNGETAGAILGFVLLAFCFFSYTNPNFVLPEKLQTPLAPISGFLTGTINGITGSQVMPSMPYLMSLNLERNIFIQAINCSFTLSSIIMALGLTTLGIMSAQAFVISVVGAFIAVIATRFGERLRNKLSAEQFRKSVLVILTAMAIVLIAKAI